MSMINSVTINQLEDCKNKLMNPEDKWELLIKAIIDLKLSVGDLEAKIIAIKSFEINKVVQLENNLRELKYKLNSI